MPSRPFSVKQAWYKATQCDIDTYMGDLDDILSHISLCDDMLDCEDQYCSVHKDEIVDLYKSIVNACIIASDHIPTNSPSIQINDQGREFINSVSDELTL